MSLQLPDVLVKLIPMDEAVIRTLSADSYRALRELVESRRPAITRLAQQRGLQRTDVWYVAFYGLAPDARSDRSYWRRRRYRERYGCRDCSHSCRADRIG